MIMKIVNRDILKEFKLLLKEYLVVVILGPRQAGKTTLAKTLKKYQYCNLESPENRELAVTDPKAFLNGFKNYVIFDEIQRVPSLLSYIQVIVDENQIKGQFVLTGSRQLQLAEVITQSLAGRVGILHLLPFSIKELELLNVRYREFQNYVHSGFLPRIYNQKQRPFIAYSNYYRTYVERDIRQMIQIKEQSLFEKFMKLLAGRVGQPLNYSYLSNDVGVDSKTIKHWLSVLEASFIIYKFCPYFKNFGKRTIKAPKYYFTEIGLLSYLLGIQNPDQVSRDPLVGSIFENLVIIEFLKVYFNKGIQPDLYFFKDSNHNEINLLIHSRQFLYAFEIKSTSTYNSSLSSRLNKIKNLHAQIKSAHIIYNGESKKFSNNTGLIHFKDINKFISKL